jgi:hypothetical protein
MPLMMVCISINLELKTGQFGESQWKIMYFVKAKKQNSPLKRKNTALFLIYKIFL